jgi:hypothetical protein
VLASPRARGLPPTLTRPLHHAPTAGLQEVTTPIGQLSFATPELLAAKGLPAEAQQPAALLTAKPKSLLISIEEIAGERGW